MDYLRLCAIVKDEDPGYLREWVDYHLKAGFEQIYLYDNDSHVSIRNSLSDFIGSGRLCVVDAPGKAMQHPAYAHCLQQFGDDTRWLAFIDADEFIVPQQMADMREFLQSYESYAALGVHWLLFGSGGHIHKPGDSQIDNFIMRTPEAYVNNSMIKSIVQPAACLMPLSAHHFLYRSGQYCVDENFQRLNGLEGSPTAQKITVFHYYCRSKEEFEKKVRRGKADDNYQNRVEIPMHNYYDVDQSAVIEDLSLKERYAAMRVESPAHVFPALQPDSRQYISNRYVLVERFLKVLERAQMAGDTATVQLLLQTMPTWYGGIIEWHLGLAEFFMENRMDDNAWQQLLAAWYLEPRSIAVLVLMGRYHILRNEKDKAEKVYGAALELDANHLDAMLNLAHIYAENGRSSQAQVLLERAEHLKHNVSIQRRFSMNYRFNNRLL